MANEVSTLTLGVDSRQVKGAARDLEELAAAGGKAESAADKARSAFAELGKVFGPVLAGFSAAKVIETADAYSMMSSRVQLATQSATDFAIAQKSIFEISQQTRVALGQTSDLFTSLARSTQSLGVSQESVLGVTKSINQALIVSGASAAGAAGALTQLGQAFSSGTLRGEELNSILEQAPRLAKAIADGLGVPIGQLRELGQAGELTAEKVFNALQKSAAAIDAEFQRMPLTVDQATTQAGNSLILLIGKLDDATGSTQTLAGIISDAAKSIGEFANEFERASKGLKTTSTAAEILQTVFETVRVVTANVVFVLKGVGREIGAIAAQVVALGRLDLQAFRAISDAVKADAERARKELDDFERKVMTRAPRLNSTAGAGRGEGGYVFSMAGANQTTATAAAKATKAAAERVSEAERYLEALRRQLQGVRDLSVEEKLLEDIQAGRLGKVTALQQQSLVQTARQIDAIRKQKEEERDALKIAQDRQRARNQEYDDAIKAVQANEKATKDRLASLLDNTPSKVLEKQRQDVEFLTRAYTELKDENGQALLTEEQYLEAVSARLNLTADKITKTKSVAEELGMTFASAFEDAIVSGKKLSDVLGGLAQDIMKIFVRKTITEPIGGFFSDLFGGFSFGSLFGGRAIGGPVSAGGIYQVNERGPEMLSVAGKEYLMMGNQSGKVSPGVGSSVNIVQNFTVGDVATVSRLKAEIATANSALVAQLSRRTQTAW